MKKSAGKRASAFLITVCMLAAMLPANVLTASAETGSGPSSFNLNKNGVIPGISAPSAEGTEQWTGSKVYFGSLDGKPLLWRVLDNGASAGGKSAMLLQTDRIVGTGSFDAASNVWSESSVRTYLNGKGEKQFLKSFSEAELNNICQKVSQAAAEGTVQDEITYSNPALKEDTVFLLSAQEATQAAYGYRNPKARRLVSSGDSIGTWWLRSGAGSGDPKQAGVIDQNGKLAGLALTDGDGAAMQAGLAPAMYLDTSRILFTTPAGKKPDSFSQITQAAGTEDWKLTFTLDGSLNAGLNGSNKVFTPGDTVTVNHTAASAWKSSATQASALLTDENGRTLYYGKINNSSAASSGIKVPDGLEAGNYNLYIFAEQVNGEKAADFASNLGNPVNITVKLTPQIVVLPGALPITYGQSLADSALSGGSAKINGVEIPGKFTWKDASVKPGVADSQATSYEVIFTPEDTAKFNNASAAVKLQVNKIQDAPNKPSSPINVDYGVGKVNQVPLPEGWSWRAEDAGKDLTAGGATQAIARYQDTVNYANYETAVTINRGACAHKGGMATCTKQAICDICKQPYGSVDGSKHGATQVRGAKNPSCTEKGYTGDTYCQDCNQVVAKGQEIAELGHAYTSVVTREPAVDEDGIKTYTCSRCGHQYTESLGRHNHYYNQTKTIHWVGCVQQGEVEHSCACGDSYVEVTPALGHDFKVEVTAKATTSKEGVKTFTCKRCGYSYTEAIPKLAGGGGGSGSGTNSGNGGTGGGSGTGSVSDRVPFVKGNSSISGWTGINKEIGKAEDGDTINISMNESLILPSKTLETIKGKNVTLVLDIGNDMKWSISGTEVTAASLKDINLKVTKNSNAIPSGLVSKTAGELDSMQLSLAHEGEFGCKAKLQVLLDSQKAGYYANLFYYNKDAGALEYVNSFQMDGKGIAGLDLNHASDYLVVMDTGVMDGSKQEEPEETTPPVEPGEPEETVPVDNPDPVPSQGSGVSAVVIILIGLAVLAAGLLLIFLLRARSRQNEEEYEDMNE